MITSCYSIPKEKIEKLNKSIDLFNLKSNKIIEKNGIIYIDVFFETLNKYEEFKVFCNKLEK